MTKFLDSYMEDGLRDIVVVSWENHEESGGYQNEETTETVAAKKGDGYVVVVLRETMDYGPKGGREVLVVSEDNISEEKYQQLASTRTPVDTPDARNEFARKIDLDRRRNELETQLDALAPSCSSHGQMGSGFGRYGPFWRCRKPSCSNTRSMTREAKQLYSDLQKNKT